MNFINRTLFIVVDGMLSYTMHKFILIFCKTDKVSIDIGFYQSIRSNSARSN